ncbi:fungal protein [Rhizophagus irregularis DAOM 181602=DAOM 197198]|nr:fungal protein [Rhizophagus irregularis DAOM 181602=DAOM 197198]
MLKFKIYKRKYNIYIKHGSFIKKKQEHEHDSEQTTHTHTHSGIITIPQVNDQDEFYMGVGKNPFWLKEQNFMLWFHVISMIISFGTLIPIGIVLGFANSKSIWYINLQIIGMLIIIMGYFFGVMFNSSKSQDIYPSNFHSKFVTSVDSSSAASHDIESSSTHDNSLLDSNYPSNNFHTKIQSIIIFSYGISNTFLEHTGKDPWNHRDIQHATLAFMWWWAGSLGIILENKKLRKILFSKSKIPIANPIPSIIFIITAISISSHHQRTEFSLTIHRQFGGFLLLAVNRDTKIGVA